MQGAEAEGRERGQEREGRELVQRPALCEQRLCPLVAPLLWSQPAVPQRHPRAPHGNCAGPPALRVLGSWLGAARPGQLRLLPSAHDKEHGEDTAPRCCKCWGTKGSLCPWGQCPSPTGWQGHLNRTVFSP